MKLEKLVHFQSELTFLVKRSPGIVLNMNISIQFGNDPIASSGIDLLTLVIPSLCLAYITAWQAIHIDYKVLFIFIFDLIWFEMQTLFVKFL